MGERDIDVLRRRIEGEVIAPDDRGYNRHRSAFNALIDRRPAAIARCRSRDDVVKALAYSRDHDLPVAVRCGGTSDYSTVDNGIVIDVSRMKEVTVDPEARTARVGAGVTWAELDAATQEHGLAVTGARVSGLGVAGVALGGGSGWLERAFGPTCQDLVGAEVVLADGRVKWAGENEDSDLLWALRGGGGNFGIVTELHLRLHSLTPIMLSGFLAFPRERAAETARFYRHYMAEAPEQVGGGLTLFAGRGGNCHVAFCYAGPIEDGERALAPLRELGPSLDAVAPNEYRAFQAMIDLQNPYGMRAYHRGAFVRELSEEALEVVIAEANKPAPALSRVTLQPLGGAMKRLDGDAMALAIPSAPWACECLSLWPPAPVSSLDRACVDWVKGFDEAMQRFCLDATYPSLIAADGKERLVACYGSARYTRLQRLKARYDPANLFRLNPNIEPIRDPAPAQRAE